jgi:hypothetical protein
MSSNKSLGLFIFTLGTILSYHSISRKRKNVQTASLTNKSTIKAHLIDLPFEVLQIVSEFFQCDTSITDKLKYEESWRNFLNSTKKLCYDISSVTPTSLICSSLKKQSIHLSLNYVVSLSYASDLTFRAMVLSKLNNPQIQLELSIYSLTGFPFTSAGSSISPSIESLNPSFLHLSNLFCLNLHYCDLTNEDLLNLSNINTLKLSNCEKLTDISNLFIEKSQAGNDYLYPHNTEKSTNSNPKGIHSLYIYDCNNLVNGFSHITSKFFFYINHTTHGLPNFSSSSSSSSSSSIENCIIAQCFELGDITSIKGVNNLTIIDCASLYTINNLQDIHTLRIINCENLFNLFAISNIQECIVSNCLTISTIDLLELEGLNGLIIDNCPEIRCFLMNQSIQCISLQNLENLNEIFIDIPLTGMRFYGYSAKELTVNLCKDVDYLMIYSKQLQKSTNLRGMSTIVQEIAYNKEILPLFQGNGKVKNIKAVHSKCPKSKGVYFSQLSESL